jgi:hypothetical protein
MTAPGIKPPPKTRSTSATPVDIREVSVLATVANETVFAATALAWKLVLGSWFFEMVASLIVDHEPHSEQRPDHLRCWAPHFSHSNILSGFGMLVWAGAA